MTTRDRFSGHRSPRRVRGLIAATAILATLSGALLAAGCGTTGMSMGMPGSMTDGQMAPRADAASPADAAVAVDHDAGVSAEQANAEVAARIALGGEMFVAKGCAACHGPNGEGSPVAPALGGHTREAVLSQVRQPIDKMPAFGPDQVSDEELDVLATYVASLIADPDSAYVHHHDHGSDHDADGDHQDGDHDADNDHQDGDHQDGDHDADNDHQDGDHHDGAEPPAEAGTGHEGGHHDG